MVIKKTIDVVCEMPECKHRMHFDLDLTTKEARRRARRWGWAYRDRQDICPACAPQVDLRKRL